MTSTRTTASLTNFVAAGVLAIMFLAGVGWFLYYASDPLHRLDDPALADHRYLTTTRIEIRQTSKNTWTASLNAVLPYYPPCAIETTETNEHAARTALERLVAYQLEDLPPWTFLTGAGQPDDPEHRWRRPDPESEEC